MDTLADSPLIPASILFSIPSAHPPTQGSGSSVYALQVMCGIWPMASLVFTSYMPLSEQGIWQGSGLFLIRFLYIPILGSSGLVAYLLDVSDTW